MSDSCNVVGLSVLAPLAQEHEECEQILLMTQMLMSMANGKPSSSSSSSPSSTSSSSAPPPPPALTYSSAAQPSIPPPLQRPSRSLQSTMPSPEMEPRIKAPSTEQRRYGSEDIKTCLPSPRLTADEDFAMAKTRTGELVGYPTSVNPLSTVKVEAEWETPELPSRRLVAAGSGSVAGKSAFITPALTTVNSLAPSPNADLMFLSRFAQAELSQDAKKVEDLQTGSSSSSVSFDSYGDAKSSPTTGFRTLVKVAEEILGGCFNSTSSDVEMTCSSPMSESRSDSTASLSDHGGNSQAMLPLNVVGSFPIQPVNLESQFVGSPQNSYNMQYWQQFAKQAPQSGHSVLPAMNRSHPTLLSSSFADRNPSLSPPAPERATSPETMSKFAKGWSPKTPGSVVPPPDAFTAASAELDLRPQVRTYVPLDDMRDASPRPLTAPLTPLQHTIPFINLPLPGKDRRMTERTRLEINTSSLVSASSSSLPSPLAGSPTSSQSPSLSDGHGGEAARRGKKRKNAPVDEGESGSGRKPAADEIMKKVTGIKARPNFPPEVLKMLTGWLNANLGHPYPPQEVKYELAKQTGLKLKQIYSFLTDISFTGLHILSACLTSFVFGFIAYPVFVTPAIPKGTDAALPTVDAEEDDDDDSEWEEEELDGPAEPIKEALSDRYSGSGEWKMVLCIRTDLEMGKGKVAAQCGHATLAAYIESAKTDPKGLKRWENSGQPKITLKCPNEDEMLELQKKARSLGIVAKVIRDAGRTQIAAGSKTVLAVGPGPKKLVDEVTGHLKLY
ncbi:Peptidyl-tRNA hydrolase protein 2, mitochondrial [Phlyctochytrium planicorne]|nr:Peptidyl-tRNA hydrolase protein 2, mitochondrial [Phlyctochytrium planicorne]